MHIFFIVFVKVSVLVISDFYNEIRNRNVLSLFYELNYTSRSTKLNLALLTFDNTETQFLRSNLKGKNGIENYGT